ncbi:hypothetical protein PDE_05702 [Penicillium oxalicum 114-2]|uniref:Uncharacterized protein n=1 Tax=Penicillium oxalicum (strain 114-2 / CGMCC 5302) TaxID=933388 RepID=S7ZJE5_PENO1|nr:hypothetical protein PDE_05702 [Penicillium oxalicum 114-2]
MSFTIASSSVALVAPATRLPALSRLATKYPHSTRSTWHCARSHQNFRDRIERAARSIDTYQRHHEAKVRSAIESSWPTTASRYPQRTGQWTTQWMQSQFSELAGREKTYWDAELEEMNQRMAKLKNLVARDPYELLFGDRAFFSHYDQPDIATNQESTEPSKSTFHSQGKDSKRASSQFPPSPSARGSLVYDPISGRMTSIAHAPQSAEAMSAAASQSTQTEHSPRHELDVQPESQLEARLVAEATRAQLSDPVIECAPGSELEALFTSSPAQVEATHYTPATATSEATVIRTHDVVDTTPKKETSLSSEARTSENRDASDESLATKFQEDPIYEVLQNHQSFGSEVLPNEATYRILAYDSGSGKVTSTEADTFFGARETAQTHEILSRLHNPARFVRYFGKMQEDGYEIATGGGDILVFKRVPRSPSKHPVPAPVAGSEVSIPEEIQDDLKNYQVSETAFDTTRYVHHYDALSPTNKPSTFGPTAPTSQPNSISQREQTKAPVISSSSHTKPDSNHRSTQPSSEPTSSSTIISPDQKSHSRTTSTFRRILRRMVLTGTITAASCYALGVLVEYFRTGGIDGRGADAFTTFESERRHGS